MVGKAIRALVVAAGVLLLVELALRLFVPRDALLFAWERSGEVLTFGAEGAVEARPSASGTKQDGAYVYAWRTNAQGFREDADTPAGRPAGRRLLALGDSWIFGVSATQGRTLPDHLERRLGVEVVNAGVPGSSGFDVLRRWTALADRYAVDGVVLGRPHAHLRQAFVEAERDRWYRYRDAPPPPDVRLYLLLRRPLAPLRWARYAPAGPTDGEAAQIADILAVVADARARGLPVWVALFPVDLHQSLVRREPDPAWVTALDGAGVPWAGNPLGDRDCWGQQDVQHPNEDGYAVLAEALAARIGGAPSGYTPARSCRGAATLP